jgi:hypothetical protein
MTNFFNPQTDLDQRHYYIQDTLTTLPFVVAIPREDFPPHLISRGCSLSITGETITHLPDKLMKREC